METKNPLDSEKALADVLGEITTEQLEMNKVLGRVETLNTIADSIQAFSLVQLSGIKESKLYRHFNNQTIVKDGIEVPLNTWAGFCTAINSNQRTIDDKLANLKLLGEEALQKSEALGITTRQLRQLRKLDENDQKVIIGEIEANVGDKDSIVELIEDMSVKHAKEKQALKDEIKDQKKQVKSLQDEAQAKDRVLADKNKLIDEKTTALELKLTAPAHDRACEYAQKISVLQVEAVQLFGKLTALYEHISNDTELPEQLRVNQGHFLLEIKAQANAISDQFFLGDVSVDDDELEWITQANAEIAERNSQNQED